MQYKEEITETKDKAVTR